MNEEILEQLDAMRDLLTEKRGAAIIDGREYHEDGYMNMLNKVGTQQDNSISYQYNREWTATDLELENLYEGNGLFAKIIDRPSEEAVKHGLAIDYGDEEIENYIESRLDELGYEEKFATAEKWTRLYGGAIIVMLVDDGGGLEEPLDMKKATKIEELRVFERAVVEPDYSTLYNFNFYDSMNGQYSYGEPEWYQVFSMYGYFRVHKSRCLVFRNGRVPEQTTDSKFRYWGIPEYLKIKKSLRECITAHEDGVKILERSAQAIYKMKGLSNMLATVDGEDMVIKRLQLIDMARNIINSIAIDNDGEDYDFKQLSLSGVGQVIDSVCNMLSAETSIPQTILFGKSPSGMNSTGHSDMENYYNLVENIQKQNMKSNTRILIDLILQQGLIDERISNIPDYKVEFASLWSMTEREQVEIDKMKIDAEKTKVDMLYTLLHTGVLDPSEVRRQLAEEGTISINEILDEDDLDISEGMSLLDFQNEQPSNTSSEEDKKRIQTAKSEMIMAEAMNGDEEPLSKDKESHRKGAAVLVIKDGKILCGVRRNSEGMCGPGGHIEPGENDKEAALRETQEEFNIVPLSLTLLGNIEALSDEYAPSTIYITDKYSGEPDCDGDEIMTTEWITPDELLNRDLFVPFRQSLELLVKKFRMDGGPGSGDFGHEGREGQVGGSKAGTGGAKMSPAKAIEEYQNYAFEPVNEGLRKGEKLIGKAADVDAGLQKAFSEAEPTRYERIVNRYSGAAVSAEFFKRTGFDKVIKESGYDDMLEASNDIDFMNKMRDACVGQVFEEKGYCSTSSDRGSFVEFANGMGSGSSLSSHGTSDSMTIQVPKGTKVLELGEDGYIMGSGENEVLLNKGSRFECFHIDYSYETNTLNFYMRMIGSDGEYKNDSHTDGGVGSGNFNHAGRQHDNGSGTDNSSTSHLHSRENLDRIKEKTYLDGAPYGNKNAVGHHKKKGKKMTDEDKKQYEKRLVGLKASDGIEVKSISKHAFDRLEGRLMSVGRVERTITNGKAGNGNTPGTRTYDIEGSRAVLNKDGNLVSVMWRRNK